MSHGIAVDANVMREFTLAYKSETDCPALSLVVATAHSPGLAIDEGGKIERQWLDTCGSKRGSPFFEWFYQNLKEGQIKKVKAHVDERHPNALRIDCGFPSDRFEITYVEVAAVAEPHYIVSEDIHFYEPKLKFSDEKSKKKAKQKRTGRVCSYLRKIGIYVGTVEQATTEIPYLCLKAVESGQASETSEPETPS